MEGKSRREQQGTDKQGNPGIEAFSRESLRLFWANRVLPSGRLKFCGVRPSIYGMHRIYLRKVQGWYSALRKLGKLMRGEYTT